MFDKQYFIEKFGKLTDDEVGIGSLNNHCALWHCGARQGLKGYVHTKESLALCDRVARSSGSRAYDVFRINDDALQTHCVGATPRLRILNALAKLPD
jgi:hypothetical protein